ncbi:Alpha/Beta hydrolase protein [Polychytrium aggregatum]|uniref:Alpha/Beta hydrolase protein n=1 Tax=Polychytrium aggregatum TaxID=110093 RepID=UPI0022FF16AD|nr:Alpha/Beta hydrolase protein [Polychytrium aggregatum]KAI9205639.1 Alpha/Beta hydrolase protein [Polychytrium aggregatum]
MDLPVERTERWISIGSAEIYSLEWKPKETPVVAAIHFIHGHGDHMSRYDAVLGPIAAQNGFYIRGIDQRGFGETGTRSKSMGNCQGMDVSLGDIAHISALIRNDYPSVPLFLMGYSRGGALALLHAWKQPDIVRGVIALSPPLAGPNPGFVAKTALFLLGSLVPGFVMDTGKDATPVTRNSDLYEWLLNDPLNTSKISIATVRDILCTFPPLFDKDVPEALECPLLVLFGGDDKIVPPDSGRKFVEKAKSTDKTFKEFPGARHSLLFELEETKLAAIDTLSGWIKERI